MVRARADGDLGKADPAQPHRCRVDVHVVKELVHDGIVVPSERFVHFDVWNVGLLQEKNEKNDYKI